MQTFDRDDLDTRREESDPQTALTIPFPLAVRSDDWTGMEIWRRGEPNRRLTHTPDQAGFQPPPGARSQPKFPRRCA